MSLVASYLRLAGPYSEALGLSWRVDENVIVQTRQSSTKTWAFAEEIAEFLDGFAGQRRIIHFEHMMQLVEMLRLSPSDQPRPGRERLWRLFATYGKPMRHAGAFCASLCGEVPDAVEADHIADICVRLRRSYIMIHWFLLEQANQSSATVAFLAPWSSTDFEAHVSARCSLLEEVEIRHWLEHGRGPVDRAGQALARELPTQLAEPRTHLLDRPRLKGAGAFIAQLNGALALPPRQLTYQDLPLGGFTDVTTRGKIEDVLLSQFALDEVDFFRRYAEHELLFFRREDPNTHVRQEMAVLVDQGVRTWGDVRLVLAAAVLALRLQAERRPAAFLLATTARTQLIDPTLLSDEELGELLEASDLSLHPGEALAALLEQPADCPRDCVLLTHPNSLHEPDVRAAIRRIPPETRLFALSLDRHGHAELSQLRHGVPVPVRQFRVNFSQRHVAEPEPAMAADEPPTPYHAWTGDVEPIGFPFGFGVHGHIPDNGFDFDGQEQCLLTVCKNGLLHLWDLDGSLREILPRPLKGEPLTELSQVLGVADGFVILGKLTSKWFAAHYRLGKRTCTLHTLGEWKEPVLFHAPRQNCILAIDSGRSGCSIDLDTKDRYNTTVGGGTERTRAAWDAWTRREVPRRELPIGDYEPGQHVNVNRNTGEAIILPESLSWPIILFMQDGKPVLRDQSLCEVQVGGQTAVLRVIERHGRNQLGVFNRNGRMVASLSMGSQPLGFRLSSGGELLARQLNNRTVLFGPASGQPTRQNSVGGFAQNLRFYLGKNELFIFPGTRQLYHHLHWDDGALIPTTRHSEPQLSPSLVEGKPRPMPIYDPQRWTSWAENHNLIAASDCYGHVAIFDRRLVLLAMFIAFRNRLAGWLPDGTCFGPALMTGKPAHTNAMVRFGQVLARAPRDGDGGDQTNLTVTRGNWV